MGISDKQATMQEIGKHRVVTLDYDSFFVAVDLYTSRAFSLSVRVGCEWW